MKKKSYIITLKHKETEKLYGYIYRNSRINNALDSNYCTVYSNTYKNYKHINRFFTKEDALKCEKEWFINEFMKTYKKTKKKYSKKYDVKFYRLGSKSCKIKVDKRHPKCKFSFKFSYGEVG